MSQLLRWLRANQCFALDLVISVLSINNISSIISWFIPFLTCWLFLSNQSVVRLISVHHWLKFQYDVNVSCFLMNFILLRHEKSWPCLMKLHKKIIGKKGLSLSIYRLKIISETGSTTKYRAIRYFSTLVS